MKISILAFFVVFAVAYAFSALSGLKNSTKSDPGWIGFLAVVSAVLLMIIVSVIARLPAGEAGASTFRALIPAFFALYLSRRTQAKTRRRLESQVVDLKEQIETLNQCLSDAQSR